MRNKYLLLFISIISILFFLAIGFDMSPFLRGPAPYPPDWQWEYFFVNTINKIWLPLLCAGAVILLYVCKDSKKIVCNEKIFLFLLVLLSFLFQLSVVYYSRSGIPVLFHRIANPDLNGYFTAALSIDSIVVFLKNFNDIVLSLPQHAQGHPPGAILFFFYINRIMSLIPGSDFFLSFFHPSHTDVNLIWLSLKNHEKMSALFTGVFIPFLSSMTIIPLYYLAKFLYGKEAGIRSVFLYIFIPSIVLFIPINDVFLPLFPITSVLLFVQGFRKQQKLLFLLSGLIFSLGLFFSLSLLPITTIFAVFLLWYCYQKRELTLQYFKLFCFFILGFLVFPLFLYYFFHYNFLLVGKTLMSGLPDNRLYTTWVFYNLYDFFIFSGIPALVLFFIYLYYIIKNILAKTIKEIDPLFWGFSFMLFVLNFSGAVRGEVARIWIPFFPFLVLIVVNYITNYLHFSKKYFLIILILQAIQILVMQEFWVMLW